MEPVEEGKETEESAPEFHPFVRLMLARMRSNPQEFVKIEHTKSSGRNYTRDVDNASQFLNTAERSAIREGMREANLNFLHERALKSLLIREPK
jgi:hypothetical protein